MLMAKGYEQVSDSEIQRDRFVRDICDFGVSTMLNHLAEDKEIEDRQSFELYDDYTAYRLIRGDTTYYKFQTESTNDRKFVKATILIACNMDDGIEFLEDYQYEIRKGSRGRR